MNGWYDDMLGDYISANDKIGAKAHIDWMDKNRLPTTSYSNFNALYLHPADLVNNAIVPELIEYAHTKDIHFGLAFSAVSEVNTMLVYNHRQPTMRTTFKFVITEMEPYSTGGITYAQMTAAIGTVKSIINPDGMPMLCYMGWPTASYWKTIIDNCVEVNLHCYLPSTNITPTSVWNYVAPRLEDIAQATKVTGKKERVNIIYSNEPAFSYNYFTTHSWDSIHAMFLNQYGLNASQAMKDNLVVGDMVMFLSRFGKQIKP